MIGGVDLRRRPLLRLTFDGHDDDMLMTVDTGFNGELMLSAADAKAWGIEISGLLEDVVLGDGSEIETSRSFATINWMGAWRDVEVYITTDAASRDLRPADEPLGLIGTRLLADDLLEINFPQKTLVIRQPAD
jgi:predicted aspartyl protease